MIRRVMWDLFLIVFVAQPMVVLSSAVAAGLLPKGMLYWAW